MHEPPGALATRRPDVAPFVDAAVRRALANLPEDRFPERGGVRRALAMPARSRRARMAERRRTRWRRAAAPCRRARHCTPPSPCSASGWPADCSCNLPAAAGASRADPRAHGETAPSPSFARRDCPRGRRRRRSRSPSSTAAAVRCDDITPNRPWTPRFSPDGRTRGVRRVRRGPIDERPLGDRPRRRHDAKRLTDDDVDANDPQWSPDGTAIAYSASAPGGKDVGWFRSRAATRACSRRAAALSSRATGCATAARCSSRTTPGRTARHSRAAGGRIPGAALRGDVGGRDRSARSHPMGAGSRTRPTSRGSRRSISTRTRDPGVACRFVGRRRAPCWRGDGRELYYWHDGALIAVQFGEAKGGAPPRVGADTLLFRAPYCQSASTRCTTCRPTASGS